MPQLALFFLGAARVQHHGQSIEFDRHKSLALLAYLALTDQPHRRDSLAALLWPDLDQRRARAVLLLRPERQRTGAAGGGRAGSRPARRSVQQHAGAGRSGIGLARCRPLLNRQSPDG
jgi:hypothetical protein